jgi:predicted oxidoreductase (fatty acid repression mutant protein)
MRKKALEKFEDTQVTDSMLQEASQLFSENHSVWCEQAAEKFAKAWEVSRCLVAVGSVFNKI